MQILQNNRYMREDADEGQGYIDNSDIQQSGDLQYSHILHFQTKVVGTAKMGEDIMRAMEVRSRIKLAESVVYTHKQAYRRGSCEGIERRVINQEMAFFGKAAGLKAKYTGLLEHCISSFGDEDKNSTSREYKHQKAILIHDDGRLIKLDWTHDPGLFWMNS